MYKIPSLNKFIKFTDRYNWLQRVRIFSFLLGEGALASKNRLEDAAVSSQVSTALIFFLHSVLVLYILLYFSKIVQSLYLDQGESMVSFYVFAEILPGLLFFSAVTSQEPLYEAEEKVAFLQKTVILIALLNFTLNCFFVPFAGFFAAAFATSGSMFVYFILFGKHLNT